ncbi:hypothetical protein AK812_SmicGene5869 [Symbiodinium microadriaticum]|uniref:Uncharacterized protein n=1 Tax=Symbiodinium microadriaticum TaxID=2951 RepID=A0A1Q9ESL9_SYMMI|nr:hypothetical protein AK812_SmicGene5869 [Symbiodinium microadriaticum]
MATLRYATQQSAMPPWLAAANALGVSFEDASAPPPWLQAAVEQGVVFYDPEGTVHSFSARSLTHITHQRLAHQETWGGLSDALQSAGDAISSAAQDVVGSVTDSAAKALLGDRAVDKFELPPPSIRQINIQVVTCVGVLLAVLGMGYAADVLFPAKKVLTRPSYTCLAMLLGSYAILIPGLVSNLFEFLLGVQMLGINVLLTEVDGEPGPIAESTFGLVHLLCKTGGYVGAILVVIYAMVIPSVKLIALIVAEIWRDSEDPRQVQKSKRFIQVVQFISKWACPDMFAYILLLHWRCGAVHIFYVADEPSPGILRVRGILRVEALALWRGANEN